MELPHLKRSIFLRRYGTLANMIWSHKAQPDLMAEISRFYEGKSVLVTGGAGAIGSNVVRALVDAGAAHIYVIDNLSSGSETNLQEVSRTTLIKGDIADPDTLEQAFCQSIDVVIHLAAFFANQNSVEYPRTDAYTNIIGTIELLEASKRHGNPLFLYANTSCMYSHHGHDWTERSKDFFYDTPYSISKHTGEQYTKFFYKYHQLPAVSARIFNSYGPYEHPGRYRNVIPNFLRAAMNGESLTITGTGNETRSFTYVDDTVRGLLLSLARYDGSWQIYNIGSTTETRIIDLAEKINLLTGNQAPVTFAPRRDWDKSTRRRPNINRARKRLDFHPTVDLDEGLSRTFSWFKEHVKV